MQEKGCDEWWWQALVFGCYVAAKAGGGAAKRKGIDVTPQARSFLLEKGELVPCGEERSRTAEGDEGPSPQGTAGGRVTGAEDGEEGESVQG